ncbi:MAG: hypothetical protein ACTHK7_01710 [Aureliella sp.]
MVWWFTHLLEKALAYLNWMFNTMDVTQWGLFSFVMVALGFIAIKCR